MKTNNLTIKQEKFCQAYIRLGDKSAAYREAYNASNMKPESVNNKAYVLFDKVYIRSRIDELRAAVAERNKITLDELISTLAGMVRFDPAKMYDENGNLKNIHDIPVEGRRMISKIKSFEEYSGRGENRELIGFTKEVDVYDKLTAVEKLMKHLGGYERDNQQKTPLLTGIKVEIVKPEDNM